MVVWTYCKDFPLPSPGNPYTNKHLVKQIGYGNHPNEFTFLKEDSPGLWLYLEIMMMLLATCPNWSNGAFLYEKISLDESCPEGKGPCVGGWTNWICKVFDVWEGEEDLEAQGIKDNQEDHEEGSTIIQGKE
jgi:hypothetical protein